MDYASTADLSKSLRKLERPGHARAVGLIGCDRESDSLYRPPVVFWQIPSLEPGRTDLASTH